MIYSPKSAEKFRNYFNNYLSVGRYAEDNGLSEKDARNLLDQGRYSHNLEVAVAKIPNSERFIVSNSIGRVDVFFDGVHSRPYRIDARPNEVLLREWGTK